MRIKVEPRDSGKKWSIAGDTDLGVIERFATAYLVTLPDGRKIKRFRMIDALREALGDDAQIEIVNPPKDPPTELE